MNRRQTTVLALLALAVAINYIDRGILSVAADPLSRELGLGPAKIGMLLSAFFWTYATCQIAAGWLLERYTVRWIYAGGYTLWSLATAATGLAPGFGVMFGARLVLGAGESVSYPANSKVIASGIPERRRGLANSVIDAGARVGSALGVLIGGWMIAKLQWRGMFMAVGGVSLLWLIPWLLSTEGLAATHAVKPDADKGPTTLDILKRRQAWGAMLGLFAFNYAAYFMITWLPLYFARERHYSQQEVATYGSLPFWCTAVSAVFCGWLSDRLVAAGFPSSKVRRTFAVGGLWLMTMLVPAGLVSSSNISLALIVGAAICCGMYSSHGWLTAQTLAGPQAAARWTGLQNAFGNLAGVVAPMLTGWLIEATGTFVAAFAAVGCVLVAGGLAQLFVIGEVRPIDWSVSSRQPAAGAP